MEYMKVKNHDELVRDPNSKAIVTTDRKQYAQFLSQKNQVKKIQELESFQTEVKDDINTLKQQMSQLQELILKSLENKT